MALDWILDGRQRWKYYKLVLLVRVHYRSKASLGSYSQTPWQQWSLHIALSSMTTIGQEIMLRRLLEVVSWEVWCKAKQLSDCESNDFLIISVWKTNLQSWQIPFLSHIFVKRLKKCRVDKNVHTHSSRLLWIFKSHIQWDACSDSNHDPPYGKCVLSTELPSYQVL